MTQSSSLSAAASGGDLPRFWRGDYRKLKMVVRDQLRQIADRTKRLLDDDIPFQLFVTQPGIVVVVTVPSVGR